MEKYRRITRSAGRCGSMPDPAHKLQGLAIRIIYNLILHFTRYTLLVTLYTHMLHFPCREHTAEVLVHAVLHLLCPPACRIFGGKYPACSSLYHCDRNRLVPELLSILSDAFSFYFPYCFLTFAHGSMRLLAPRGRCLPRGPVHGGAAGTQAGRREGLVQG